MRQKIHLITKVSHAQHVHMKQYAREESKAKEITGVIKLKTTLLNSFIALVPTVVYLLHTVHHTIPAIGIDTAYYAVNVYGTIQ